MVLTLSIMSIIVAFSLYDYFSSRSWQAVTSKERNETVFENRNKEYGAYKNRNDYDKRLILIFLGFTVGVGALWGASNLFRPLEQRKDPTLITENITELFKDDKVVEIPQPEIIEQPAAQSLADITEFREIVASDLPDIPPVEIVNPETPVGTQTQKGTGDIWTNPVITTIGTGTGGGTPPPPPTGDPIDIVDEPALFPGGMDALRKYIADNIELDMIDGTAKVYLKFIVDTDGGISTVMVTKSSDDCKSCEKAAIKVVKGMPKWTPGKVNGEPVRSYYRLPINIK
nr:energy transducer TonB [uncultured Fluviicola sp.]